MRVRGASQEARFLSGGHAELRLLHAALAAGGGRTPPSPSPPSSVSASYSKCPCRSWFRDWTKRASTRSWNRCRPFDAADVREPQPLPAANGLIRAVGRRGVHSLQALLAEVNKNRASLAVLKNVNRQCFSFARSLEKQGLRISSLSARETQSSLTSGELRWASSDRHRSDA